MYITFTVSSPGEIQANPVYHIILKPTTGAMLLEEFDVQTDAMMDIVDYGQNIYFTMTGGRRRFGAWGGQCEFQRSIEKNPFF